MPDLILINTPLNTMIVSSEYGKRVPPKSGASSNHQGIDLYGNMGEGIDPIYATHSGKIIRAGMSSSLGNFVIIQDDISGMATIYCHMHNKKFGDIYSGSPDHLRVINAGEEIGKIGKTGLPDIGVHLHMEILSEESANRIKNEGAGDSYIPGGPLSSAVFGKARLNPRPYLATLADDLARTELINGGNQNPTSQQIAVRSSQIFSSDIDLTGKVSMDVEGDHRDNIFTANDRDNKLSGASGSDTYSISLSSSGKDQIIDSDHTGTIILDGTAISSPQIFAIEGSSNSWRMTHGGVDYHLARINDNNLRDDNGSNLMIIKEADADDTNSVRINNFDFTNGGFGININNFAGDISPIIVGDGEYSTGDIVNLPNDRTAIFTIKDNGGYNYNGFMHIYDQNFVRISSIDLGPTVGNSVNNHYGVLPNGKIVNNHNLNGNSNILLFDQNGQAITTNPTYVTPGNIPSITEIANIVQAQADTPIVGNNNQNIFSIPNIDSTQSIPITNYIISGFQPEKDQIDLSIINLEARRLTEVDLLQVKIYQDNNDTMIVVGDTSIKLLNLDSNLITSNNFVNQIDLITEFRIEEIDPNQERIFYYKDIKDCDFIDFNSNIAINPMRASDLFEVKIKIDGLNREDAKFDEQENFTYNEQDNSYIISGNATDINDILQNLRLNITDGNFNDTAFGINITVSDITNNVTNKNATIEITPNTENYKIYYGNEGQEIVIADNAITDHINNNGSISDFYATNNISYYVDVSQDNVTGNLELRTYNISDPINPISTENIICSDTQSNELSSITTYSSTITTPTSTSSLTSLTATSLTSSTSSSYTTHISKTATTTIITPTTGTITDTIVSDTGTSISKTSITGTAISETETSTSTSKTNYDPLTTLISTSSTGTTTTISPITNTITITNPTTGTSITTNYDSTSITEITTSSSGKLEITSLTGTTTKIDPETQTVTLSNSITGTSTTKKYEEADKLNITTTNEEISITDTTSFLNATSTRQSTSSSVTNIVGINSTSSTNPSNNSPAIDKGNPDNNIALIAAITAGSVATVALIALAGKLIHSYYRSNRNRVDRIHPEFNGVEDQEQFQNERPRAEVIGARIVDNALNNNGQYLV